MRTINKNLSPQPTGRNKREKPRKQILNFFHDTEHFKSAQCQSHSYTKLCSYPDTQGTHDWQRASLTFKTLRRIGNANAPAKLHHKVIKYFFNNTTAKQHFFIRKTKISFKNSPSTREQQQLRHQQGTL